MSLPRQGDLALVSLANLGHILPSKSLLSSIEEQCYIPWVEVIKFVSTLVKMEALFFYQEENWACCFDWFVHPIDRGNLCICTVQLEFIHKCYSEPTRL